MPPAGNGPLIALHISARKPAQRWPIERFAQLAQALHAARGARFLLFWSPGADDHAQHPGDDKQAARLVELCAGLPLLACTTNRLGGAMHLAAGLGKPLVCFFGNSGAPRWHPWAVPHELLQPPSRNVVDVSLDDALQAFERLEQRLLWTPRPAADAASRPGDSATSRILNR